MTEAHHVCVEVSKLSQYFTFFPCLFTTCSGDPDLSEITSASNNEVAISGGKKDAKIDIWPPYSGIHMCTNHHTKSNSVKVECL